MSGVFLVSLRKCYLRVVTNDSEDKFMVIFPDVQVAGGVWMLGYLPKEEFFFAEEDAAIDYQRVRVTISLVSDF